MKNTIYIDIHLSEVIYEVKQTTHIKNVTVDNEESFKTASNLQVDSETDQLTYRCVGNAYAELKSRLSEYVNEQGTTANNKLFDEDSNVSVVLYVPTNFNLAVKDSIAASMHQFMVATSIREWYTITSKDDAKDYRLTGDEAIKLIIANINKRLRQTRGTLPNYSNDIKGGTFDAESNSLVFTNDLQKELFRITLPTDGTVTNGYYDALTGIVHLENPSQEDVFTIDLSPLKSAAVDYSLQEIYVDEGNVVFTFNNEKPEITLPISDIVTLPDMSEYYKKNETYDRATIDSMVAAARNGGYMLATTLPTASADTVGKIYLKPKANAETSNVKDEYITIQENDTYKWEKIGDTHINLEDFPTWDEIEQDGYYIKPSTGIPSNDLESQFLSSLERRISIVEVTSDTEIDAEFGEYYVIKSNGSRTINLPEVSASPSYLLGFMAYFEVTDDDDMGLTPYGSERVEYQDGFDIQENGRYEIKVTWNGMYWQVKATKFTQAF